MKNQNLVKCGRCSYEFAAEEIQGAIKIKGEFLDSDERIIDFRACRPCPACDSFGIHNEHLWASEAIIKKNEFNFSKQIILGFFKSLAAVVLLAFLVAAALGTFWKIFILIIN